MTDEEHVFPSATSKFCSTRVCSCGKENQYQDCCKSVREEWKIVQGSQGFLYGFEAHHILCVESMSYRPKGESGEKLHQLLMRTEWCINDKNNMIALPKFGHTVKWYSIRKMSDKPNWNKLPHHDVHHNNTGGYRDEVGADIKDAMKEWTDEIEEKNCKLSTAKIVTRLDKLVGKWKSKISTRGEREGGIHSAWGRAVSDDKYHKWIMPFSMAKDSLALMLSVPFEAKHTAKLDQLVTAIGGK